MDTFYTSHLSKIGAMTVFCPTEEYMSESLEAGSIAKADVHTAPLKRASESPTDPVFIHKSITEVLVQ